MVNCDAAAGSKDGRSQWTLEANNQLMSGHPGQYCLSQRGASPGVENVAAKAAVMASSSVDSVAHGNDVFICNSTLSWLTFTSSQGRIWPLMASMEFAGPVNLILMSPLRLRLTWVDTNASPMLTKGTPASSRSNDSPYPNTTVATSMPMELACCDHSP